MVPGQPGSEHGRSRWSSRRRSFRGGQVAGEELVLLDEEPCERHVARCRLDGLARLGEAGAHRGDADRPLASARAASRSRLYRSSARARRGGCTRPRRSRRRGPRSRAGPRRHRARTASRARGRGARRPGRRAAAGARSRVGSARRARAGRARATSSAARCSSVRARSRRSSRRCADATMRSRSARATSVSSSASGPDTSAPRAACATRWSRRPGGSRRGRARRRPSPRGPRSARARRARRAAARPGRPCAGRRTGACAAARRARRTA